MPRKSRDSKSEYAARNQRAKDAGYKNYYEFRKAQREGKSHKLPVPGHTVRLEEAVEFVWPTEYPTSTRVQAFKFSPYPETPSVGNVYVRFIKYGTAWVYRDVPEGVYAAFASAPSKGRAINTILNPYSAGNPSWEEEELYFTDM